MFLLALVWRYWNSRWVRNISFPARGRVFSHISGVLWRVSARFAIPELRPSLSLLLLIALCSASVLKTRSPPGKGEENKLTANLRVSRQTCKRHRISLHDQLEQGKLQRKISKKLRPRSKMSNTSFSRVGHARTLHLPVFALYQTSLRMDKKLT